MMQQKRGLSLNQGLLFLAWLAVLALLISLATWQVHRGQEKTRLLAAFSASQQGPVLHDLSVEQAQALLEKETVFLRTCIEGRYDAAHQFLLDGQTQDGNIGFHVWTPLVTHSGGQILVNRGWVAQTPDRRPVADLAVEDASHEVCGTLVRFPRSGWALKAAPESQTWPRVMVYPPAKEIEITLGHSIYPLLLLLDADAREGFGRHWKPVTMLPEQHYGYAFQWAALAITWVVVTTVYWRRRARESRQL
ncbi:MAG: SURF1 family protein [Pseudomonadota bacterium]